METRQVENKTFMPHLVQMVEEGHTVLIRARGFSMRPFIEDRRDMLVFGPVDVDEVKRGDVVLAERTPDVYVCHRVDKIDGDKVVLRGDGNVPNKKTGNEGVERITRKQIRAKLVRIKRKNKTYDLATSRVWKVYSTVWPRLLPVRRPLLVIYRLLWMHQLPARFRKTNKKGTK